MEEKRNPFAKDSATLQYRPFRHDGKWTWVWVLLPEDGSAALATGQEDSRPAAATVSRQEAGKLGVVITRIDVIKPHAP